MRNLWKSIEIHGESMKIDGTHDNKVKSIGNPWKSMEIDGNPSEIHGNQWKSIESPWKSMEIH